VSERERARASVDAFVAGRWLLNLAFFVVVVIMVLHESEHVAQVTQKDALTYTCPNQCRGLMGFVFDVEWVHFAYNTSILVTLGALWSSYRMWERRWRAAYPVGWGLLTLGILVQGYHVAEHSVKLAQWFANGRVSPTPGLLGKLLPAPHLHNFSLIEFHFTVNTVVLVLVLAGWFGLTLHRRIIGPRPRAAWALAAAMTFVFAESAMLAWATGPPVVHLGAGVHQGPLVIKRTQMLVGERGAVVRGGIVVEADDVTVRNVTVRGGENGIEVDGANRVLLDGVRVVGARLDGIHVRRASVMVRDCHVDARASPWAQAIDISFAFDLPPSVVQGCQIVGGREGLVSHFAHVLFRNNHVTSTKIRAIAVTEMSHGAVERNHVSGVVGTGIYCGDYSMCMIDGNSVARTRPDRELGDRTLLGYGILAHFGATAELGDNTLGPGTRGPAAMVKADIIRR
jgi:hypothetical protein